MSTPISLAKKLSRAQGDTLSSDDAFKYRSLVGGLQYLTLTRPDFLFAVKKVCQFLSQPTTVHYEAINQEVCSSTTPPPPLLPSNSIKAHVQAHIQNPVYPRIGMWIEGIPTYRHPILFKFYPIRSSFPDPSHLCVGPDHRRPGQPHGHYRRTSRPLPDSLSPNTGQSGSLFLVRPDKSPDNLLDSLAPSRVCYQ
jgi:hypothetical protein